MKKENEERNARDRPQLHSTPGPTQKNLAPPKPPARRSVKGTRSQTINNNVTGYSNIHRLKMKKEYNNGDPHFKLNNIV